jgi:hypothetical protein
MTSKWLAWTPQSEPAKPTELAPFNLSGHAVEFERNGTRHFLVADEADAQRLIEPARRDLDRRRSGPDGSRSGPGGAG